MNTLSSGRKSDIFVSVQCVKLVDITISAIIWSPAGGLFLTDKCWQHVV